MNRYKYDSFTNILFPEGGFIKGMMRALDLFGVTDAYNISDSPQEADSKALYSDWVTTGNDIRNAMETCANEQ